MNIACIVFQTSDYKKAALEAQTYRAVIRSMGHGFDILFSNKDPVVSSYRFPRPDYVEGRHDSKIIVDGVVSHHPNRAKSAGAWLTANYDAVLFMGLCPYPTRAYGSEPHWLDLYRAIKIPKLGKIIDIMPGTNWPKLAVAELDLVYTSQAAFMPDNRIIPILPTPYLVPSEQKIMGPKTNKTAKRSVIWSGGWNRADGIVEFIKEIPKIGKHSEVTLTGIGSQYFRQRKKDFWIQAVRLDNYGEFDGVGLADFLGAGKHPGQTPLMGHAWAAVDLVGLEYHGEHSHSYSEGVYTHSMIEALYKGTWPVVAAQCVGHSPIPSQFLWRSVANQDEISETIKLITEPLVGTQLGDRAKAWVMDTHDARMNSATIIQEIRRLK